MQRLIPTDRLIALHLADGTIMAGRVTNLRDGWALLRSNEGERLVNLTQVAWIDLNSGREDSGPVVQDGIPRPTSKDAPVRVGSKAPGRPWSDDDLRVLADAFLDGRQDGELAERFHRTRSQIRDLRQGFECNRGNVPEDLISPASTTWVERWQRVLARR